MLTFKKLAALWLPLNLLWVTAQADVDKSRVRLLNPGMTLLREAAFVKPVERNKKINFTVWLKLRNQDELNQLVGEMYDPSSPNYQRYLTQDEYNQQYAPSEVIEESVADYFKAQGMKAVIVNHTIRVSGKAQKIEQALQTKLNYYRHQNKTGYANASAPSIDPQLAPYVSGITGLTDMAHFRPYIKKLPSTMQPKKSLKSHDIHMIWESFTPAAQPTTTSLGGFSGKNLRVAYNLANISPINGVPIDGDGQTVVIIAECGINSASHIRSEGNVYNATNGLPPYTATNFTIIKPNGAPFTTCNTPTPTGWESEIVLDIDAVHTMAPKAKIVLVLTSSGGLGTGTVDVVNRLINNNYTIGGFSNATIVSNSWGAPEGFGYWPMEPTFQLAAAFGISSSFASGDCGDNSYNSSSCSAVSPQKTVQYPASSIYVTAVGGTSLFVDNLWHYAFETVWGAYFDGGYYFGGGGGVSQYFGPAVWQNPITFFFAGGYGQLLNYNKRALPDISMLGDPLTGLQVFSGGAWSTYGGTSLASPLFAGTLALVNQARTLKGKCPVGLAASYFYAQNSPLIHSRSLNMIVPPHQIISGATLPPPLAPLSAFTIYDITFGWDSSLTIAPEKQFWNDAVGVGSPNTPNFVVKMSSL